MLLEQLEFAPALSFKDADRLVATEPARTGIHIPAIRAACDAEYSFQSVDAVFAVDDQLNNFDFSRDRIAVQDAECARPISRDIDPGSVRTNRRGTHSKQPTARSFVLNKRQL